MIWSVGQYATGLFLAEYFEKFMTCFWDYCCSREIWAFNGGVGDEKVRKLQYWDHFVISLLYQEI